MFKAFISWVVFIIIVLVDVMMFQDFKPKYLIMIIPVTLYTVVLAWYNTKDLIDNMNNNRRKKTQETKTNACERSFCVRDEDGTLWNLSYVNTENHSGTANDSLYSGKNIKRKTSPEDQ